MVTRKALFAGLELVLRARSKVRVRLVPLTRAVFTRGVDLLHSTCRLTRTIPWTSKPLNMAGEAA